MYFDINFIYVFWHKYTVCNVFGLHINKKENKIQDYFIHTCNCIDFVDHDPVTIHVIVCILYQILLINNNDLLTRIIVYDDIQVTSYKVKKYDLIIYSLLLQKQIWKYM